MRIQMWVGSVNGHRVVMRVRNEQVSFTVDGGRRVRVERNCGIYNYAQQTAALVTERCGTAGNTYTTICDLVELMVSL